MAKRQTVKPSAKKPKRDKYPVINRVKVGDQWYEKGETISLTVEGARYFRQIHKIK